MMDGLFLLLGSNIEDQNYFIERARMELSRIFGPPIINSSIYKTEPWGNKNQAWFLNQVVILEFRVFNHQNLLAEIKEIETIVGRKQRDRWGPREVDIDILYWYDEIFHDESLKIPHPQIADRKFTLMPLVEVAPDKIHPLLGKTQSQLLMECKDTSEVRIQRLSDTGG